ncbi:MAG: AI-2E family transporter [Thiohalocapsa sp.]|nr:AI-2E family transporter [Thiohalocapsa sp.]MCF7989884.1 AI-2E family transporter [Thiohalocapsa sp.]
MNEDKASSDRQYIERSVEAAIRIGLIATMVGLCFWIVKPFLIPVAWGVIIAVAAWPGYRRLASLLGGRRALASLLFAILSLIVLILPVLALSGTLVQGAEGLARGFERGDLIPPAPDLSAVPVFGGDVEDFWNRAADNLEEALRSVEPQLQQFGKWVLSFAAEIGMGVLHFVMAIIIAAVLLANSETSRRATHAIACRLAGARGYRFAELAESVVRSVSRGILGVALIQSLLAGLGMLAAGVPAAGLWALVIMVLATIQLGAFPVMAPAVLYVFYTGETTTAVLFLIWAVFVGSLDNILKPLLLGRGVSVPMVVIFIGAIGGFIGAGIIGLFLGAVILVLGYELFLAWLQEAQLPHSPRPPSDPEGEAAGPPPE